MSSALTLSNAVHDTPSVPDGKKRIDFISKLPLEIVLCYILPKILVYSFTLPKVDPCFQVCRSWNERIIQVLVNIPFFMHRVDDSWTMEDWIQVDALTPYIKKLTVAESMPFAIWLLGERLRFPSLVDLTLTVKRSRVMKPPQPTDPNQPRSNARSVTVPEPLYLHHLLDHCPALVELKIASTEIILTATSSNHSATYPNIRHLELRYASPSGLNLASSFNTSYHISPALFKHFPQLRLLSCWHPHPRYRDLKTIFQYCPMLQQLFLGGIGSHFLLEDTTTCQEGLRLLALRRGSSHGVVIARLLKEHSTTIESLVIESVGHWTSSPAILINDHDLFPQLRSLHLNFRMSHYPIELICAVILRAPNLESVNVNRGGVQGEILETLIGRPIRTIDLVCTPWSNAASAFVFLEHHVQLRMNSTLHEIKCTITDNNEYQYGYFSTTHTANSDERFMELGGGWMYAITALQQLQSLELSLKCDVYEESWMDFLRLISQRCPSLQKLTLEFYWVSFDIEWILPLAQHGNLKELVIVSRSLPNNFSTLVRRFALIQGFDLKVKTIDARGTPRPIKIPRRFL